MMTANPRLSSALILFFLMICGASPAMSECLDCKTCSELLRLAEDCRQDLKTADMVLGAALDAGAIEKARTYKMRKAASSKQLDEVLKLIDAKMCVMSK
jgi:hypothetical protein